MKAQVLVIDDNTILADNLSEILTATGYDVRVGVNCAQAEAEARRGFDVALVDLKLPDGDGTTLAKRMKDICPHAEVILLTGFATVESASAAVRAGAWAYLVKPYDTQELLLTIEQALRHVKVLAEKRELARRAQVAEKLAAVGTLTAGLTHEIRNPLNGALLQLEVLERRVRRIDEGLQKSLLDPLQMVRDEIRRLDHVLEDFLQFARPVNFAPKPVEVTKLLQKIASFLQVDASQRKVNLECETNPVPLVAGDEGRLRQVFMNLTLNALDAVKEGGRVRLRCSSEPDRVVVTVDDDGPGIPPEMALRIFEPFFTTKAKGSGLGLPICHAIVSQHGGSLHVETSPEGGARFKVMLPRAV